MLIIQIVNSDHISYLGLHYVSSTVNGDRFPEVDC